MKYLAAITMINSENKTLESFRNNNMRASLNAKDLLQGISPYKLLSTSDRQMLVAAAEVLNNNLALPDPCEDLDDPNKIRSVFEAELDAQD